MKRREFITLVGSAAVAWPIAARAQQAAMPVIGFLDGTSADGSAPIVTAFRQGLSEVGYIEGRNVAIEFRWAETQNDRLPALAADLVRRRVVVIAAGGIPAVLAAKAVTSTIPIVFRLGTDPVRSDVVQNLNQPGSNLTGVSTLAGELVPKRLELLHEIVPSVNTIAFLVNPSNPIGMEPQAREAQAAARRLGLELKTVHAVTERDLDQVFGTFAQLRVGALLIGTNALFNNRSEKLAELALRYKMPAVYQYREFAVAGGLMSYGSSYTDSYRLTGIYAGRILKGEKPGDLPVQQSTKVELILNLKTAKALGLTVPLTLLGRADEVIE
jgi:putative tryptophan/tyrosine transport system substrate-binding protein